MGVATATRAETALDVHGLRVSIAGDWPQVVEELRLDFAWFHRGTSSDAADVEVTIERRPPDFDALGDIPATFVTPRNVVYRDAERTVVDYFGRAVSVLDHGGSRIGIQGEEKHLVHQAAYLFLLSRIGEYLDARRLPRLHGLGLTGAQGAVVVMLPSGGGKSTLALRALREPGVKLLSEDSPLIDGRVQVHPFPLRLGVNPTDVDALPDGQVREIERLEFHPKLVLELDAFADRIASEPQPLRHLVLGSRRLGRDASLTPAPRRAAAGPLFREAVVGVGLYQGMEFVLQRGARDVLGQAGPALTRVRCCTAGLAKASVWRLETGRDHDRNWAALEPLLR